jgi:hypothetical protein
MGALGLIPNSILTRGQYLPWIDITLDTKSGKWQDFSLNDFQWWAYKKDWDSWAKSNNVNASSWEASESIRNEAGNFIKESLEEWKELNASGSKNISGFVDFINRKASQKLESLKTPELNEAEGEDGNAITSEMQTQFWFAYHSLEQRGLIEENFDVSKMGENDEKAFFVTLSPEWFDSSEDPDIATFTLQALRIKPRSGFSSTKGRLVECDLREPGNVSVPNSLGSIAQDYVDDAMSAAKGFLVVAGGWLGANAIYNVIYGAGGLYALRVISQGLQYGKGAAGEALTFSGIFKGISKTAGKGGFLYRGVRFLLNPIRNIKKIKEAGWLFERGYKAARVAQAANNVKKATTAAKALNTTKAVWAGASKVGARLGAKTAVRAIPIVGWALLAVDVIGSLIVWNSDGQAPTTGDAMEKFNAKPTLNPSDIKVGETIVICWSQEDDDVWGTIVSFAVSAAGETRTTMELTKLAQSEDGGSSVFAIQSANSKSVNQMLEEAGLVLITLPNKPISTAIQGENTVDSDDVDGKIAAFVGPMDENGNPVESPYLFAGACNWDDLKNAIANSATYLFEADPNAPNEYRFNFEDSEGSRINVEGSLVSTEEIQKFTPEELNQAFFGDANIFNSSPEGEEEEPVGEEPEKVVKVSESNRVITDFRQFTSDNLIELYEDDGETAESGLDPYSGPAKVAIYLVKSSFYADKYEAKRKKPPVFENFVISPKDYNAKPGQVIEEPILNTDEEIIEPKAGLVNIEASSGKKYDRDFGAGVTGDASGEELDASVQADDKLKAPDLKIRQTQRTTVVKDRDKSGGFDIMKELVTDNDRSVLGIEDWNKVTGVKGVYGKDKQPYKIKFYNKEANFGNRSRTYTPRDSGKAFEVAKEILKKVETDIDYSN